MKNHQIWIPVIASCVLGVSACAAQGRSSSQQPNTGGVLPPAAATPSATSSPQSPASGVATTAPGGAGQVKAGNGAAGTSGGGAAVPTAATGGTSGAAADGGTMNAMPGDDGRLPIIPPISGDCPEFITSTITLMGLGGISIQAGAKKEGSPTGPLVFYWHGTGSSAFESSMFPGTTEVLSLGGVIVAFQSSLGTGGDCSGTGTFSQDDYKVADQIVACAVKNHNIDARRIYATGCSAGGLFSGCMGIERSSYLAAVVANSGGVTIGYGPFQDPKRVPAVMTMHGGAADMVIVTFSQTSMAYDTLMAKHNSAMVLDCDHMGGHCGAPPALYASGWQFMKDHPFGTKPSPYASGLPAGFDPSCKVWTDTMGMLPYGGDPTGMPMTPVTGTVWTPPP